MRRLKFLINSAVKERWIIGSKNILNSKSRIGGYGIFKFCYNPDTGEFLCDIKTFDHKEMIRAYGTKEFNDYVRGIYFKEKKVVYLRQHENQSWLCLTRKFLRDYGVSNKIRIIWGKEAAQELSSVLRGI